MPQLRLQQISVTLHVLGPHGMLMGRLGAPQPVAARRSRRGARAAAPVATHLTFRTDSPSAVDLTGSGVSTSGAASGSRPASASGSRRLRPSHPSERRRPTRQRHRARPARRGRDGARKASCGSRRRAQRRVRSAALSRHRSVFLFHDDDGTRPLRSKEARDLLRVERIRRPSRTKTVVVAAGCPRWPRPTFAVLMAHHPFEKGGEQDADRRPGRSRVLDPGQNDGERRT